MSHLKEWCQEASSAGNDILILPELWLTGFDYANLQSTASPTEKGSFADVAHLAVQYQLMIIGSMTEKDKGGYYNTCCAYNHEGYLAASYRKLHLFNPMQEDQWFSPGHHPVSFLTKFGLGGLAICYDLRFPELFRRYALDGVVISFISAEWPESRLAHWMTLVQARAIENQFFMVAANAVGQTGKAVFAGHSLVCDPWGQVLVDAGESESLTSVIIDLDEVDKVRHHIPTLINRRPEAYGP
jgi:predicted amidohydrolase